MIFLLLQFNVLLFITFTNSISVELPCLKNEKGQCLPNYIFTDKLVSFEKREISKVYEEGRFDKVACSVPYNEPRKEEFIPKNSKNSDLEDIKNSVNTVFIIEVDPEYVEIKPGRRLSSDVYVKNTYNNNIFNELRKTLDGGDENSLDVKRLSLLPEISDTNETYWNRIHTYVFTGVVELFNEYYAEKKAASSKNNPLDEYTLGRKKTFLLYALYVIENISEQVKNLSPFKKLFGYIKKFDKESDFGILDELANDGIIKKFPNYEGANSKSWLRDIRYYDPLAYESYSSYMIRCYKRNLYPLPKNLIFLHFKFELDNNFDEFPIAYSTLLLKILFTHPANDLTPIPLEETASAKK